MSSSRQRKVQRVQEGVEPHQLGDLSRADVKYPQPSNTVALCTHLFFFVFYVAVSAWGAAVLMAKRGEYSLNLARMPLLSTMINWVIQMAYFALALTSDLMPILKVKAKLKAVCSYLLTVVCFPFAMTIAVGYSILAIDTSYLYDEETASLVKVLPLLLNHSLHYAVAIGVVLELILVFHRYPSSPVALTTIFMYHFGYAAEVFLVYYVADVLPYPFLRMMGAGGMAVFFVIMYPVTVAFYYMGRALNYLMWGRKISSGAVANGDAIDMTVSK